MVSGTWPLVRLGDICKKIGSGATPRGGKDVYLSDGIALIRSQNVYNDCFESDGLAHISNEHADELAHVTVQEGDVLLNITGDSVARCCLPPSFVFPARVNQHVSIIRPDQSKLNARFLMYYLVSPSMQNYMLIMAGAGATRNALTKGMIEDFKIAVPGLDVQSAIAHVLGTLDDKIELNRQMNQTLEAMAQALFKNWFVDFEPFRDQSMQDSPVGEIPWKVQKVGQVLELKYGKGLREGVRTGGNVPVYGSNGQVGWHNESLVRGPGIVVGRKGNPGTVTWAPIDFFPIDTTFYVEPTGPIRSMAYLFHALQLLDLPSLGADSAVPGLNRNMAYMSDILVPPPAAIRSFDRYTEPLMRRVYINDRESQTLSDIRDALLPKLLSGEIRVKNTEKFLEEAA